MNAPLECIIQKYEKSTVDWKKGMSGKRSVIFREQDFKETGKRDFMNQLMELEMEGLVKVNGISTVSKRRRRGTAWNRWRLYTNDWEKYRSSSVSIN